jgi:hypothetical protein
MGLECTLRILVLCETVQGGGGALFIRYDWLCEDLHYSLSESNEQQRNLGRWSSTSAFMNMLMIGYDEGPVYIQRE